MNKKIKELYDHDTLYNNNPQRSFKGASLTEIAFPVGGIGTGNISIGGRGNLRDFEIFNRPAKGNVIPFTFFALWAKQNDKEPVAKILEGKIPPPYRSGFGEPQTQLQGIPRFANAEFTAEYPKAKVTLTDDDIPITAHLTAWNPFIPLNVKDSAIPGAILEWSFINDTDEPIDISLAANASNPLVRKNEQGQYINDGSLNTYQAAGRLKGMLMTNPCIASDDPAAGSIVLSAIWDDLDIQTRWFRGSGWWDKCHLFWDAFSNTGKLPMVIDSEPAPYNGDVCSLVMHAQIPARGSVTIPVIYTWHFPKMVNPWPDGINETLNTYSGAVYSDAWNVASYIADDFTRLRSETDNWLSAMYDSTVPDYVLEAITSQVSIIRSPTCMLLADGRFFGWEGCGDNIGSCFGNCTHVWNYEQSLAFLFPQLERTMRQTEFLYNTRPTGNMAFRTNLLPGNRLLEFKPCVDGQMGVIMQVYRDWKLSGDDDFLKEIWTNVKAALEYAWTMTPDKLTPATPESGNRSIDSLWDTDKDGVIEGEQHNTYDIEFFGPNTLCTAMYLGALRACEEIADYLGEAEKAEEYRSVYESGKQKVDAELWNGDYYIQKVNVIDGIIVPEHLKSPDSEICSPTYACKQSPGVKAPSLGNDDIIPKYQYGDGCLSDQLLGQVNAHIYGLGYILNPDNVKNAVKSIFYNNFRSPIDSFSNVQRVYALNDESGLLLCSWPKGNRPALPFVYSDEVWTGIEFHVAAHLIYEGFIDEGLTLVKAITDRYSGYNRNPWNHIECGHHYARAMASWGVKLALDGFTFDMIKKQIGFAPKINKNNYSTFWSVGSAWGHYTQNLDKFRYAINVKYGELNLALIKINDLPNGTIDVMLNGEPLQFNRDNDLIEFHNPITMGRNDLLIIQ